MDLIFNELSIEPLLNSLDLSENRIRHFIDTFVKAKEVGFKNVRFDNDMNEVFLTKEINLLQWLTMPRTSTNGKLKDYLWSIYKKPYIKSQDDDIIEKYYSNEYFLKIEEKEVECQGFGASYAYGTICISFYSKDIWFIEKQQLIIKNDESDEKIEKDVYQIAKPEHVQNLKEIIENLKNIELIKTELLPEEKIIKLRDDHGKDVLQAFSNKLIKSPYVIGVINSLPFNSQLKRFIKTIHENGLVEVVLHWTDKGYGIAVQTTGRNLRETEAIATILEEEYNE